MDGEDDASSLHLRYFMQWRSSAALSVIKKARKTQACVVIKGSCRERERKHIHLEDKKDQLQVEIIIEIIITTHTLSKKEEDRIVVLFSLKEK